MTQAEQNNVDIFLINNHDHSNPSFQYLQNINKWNKFVQNQYYPMYRGNFNTWILND